MQRSHKLQNFLSHFKKRYKKKRQNCESSIIKRTFEGKRTDPIPPLNFLEVRCKKMKT
jgi:hypothetical protein